MFQDLFNTPTPPFSLQQPSRYNQASYFGRFRHFFDVINPRTLLTSDEELQRAQKLLQDFKNGTLDKSVTDDQLWKAKAVQDSIVHPDTGKKIFWPCRMSAFTPVNVPIVAGMLYTAPTIGNTIFFQWLNQSVNVAVNHANRNASNEMSNEQIFKAYGAAVAVSCGLALGLGEVVKRSTSTLIPKFVPFFAVASAGALNVLLMRKNEAEKGITVKDEQGNDVGISKIAGQMALKQVAITRVVLPAPVLLLPPLLMRGLDSFKFVQERPKLRAPLQLLTVTASLLFALPLAIAVFPQITEVPVQELEPEFRNLRDAKGSPIQKLFFNKGL